MHHHFVDWPYRVVTRAARLLRRNGKVPARPYANIEGYKKHVAPVLIKNMLKRWLDDNPGFGVIIRGPGARAPNLQTAKYYIRCFGEIKFRSSDRNCIIDYTSNAGYLLHVESKALRMSSRFSEVAWRASQRCRPHNESKPEISDFISVGHVGPVLQGFGGDLRLQKLESIPPHGHHDSPDVLFNWLFENRIHGHVYLARLYEAGVVDHLVVIDYRRWPSLIYDSCDPYLLVLSSTSLFQRSGPDAEKVIIT